jgi:renalase
MATACIIGAGFSGLACAHRLQAAGWSVTIIDKGRHVGGRCATRRLSDRDLQFDTGAQFWSTRDEHFAAATAGWVAQGWAYQWCTGIPVLRANGIDATSDGFPRWRPRCGMRHLLANLAQGLAVTTFRTVTALSAHANQWRVHSGAGDLVRGGGNEADVSDQDFDVVVLTQPVPQISELFAASGVVCDPRLAEVSYDRCLYLLSECDADGDAVPQPGALRIEDPAHAALWLGSGRGMGLRTRGEGVLLHADATISAALWDAEAATQVAELTRIQDAVLGRIGTSFRAERAEVRRWRYAKCAKTLPEPCLMAAPGLVLAGDAFGDRPRLEGAWLSGVAAADAFLA